jgi:phosphoserine phosphatase RsbU/P
MSFDHYQVMWQTLASAGEWRGEIQNLRKNGDVYWVYESISAIKNSAGDITHYVAVEEDISRRKQIETALSESEERFRQMAEMTGEWLWEQDPNGYYLYSSNAVKQILGFAPEQIIGKHYTAFLTIQDQESQQTYAASEQPFYALINHYQHKDGRQVLTESTGLPIINAEGKLVKWRGVDRDITARMHFQEALVESEKRIRLIIESSINAIVIMDSYGIITDWNRRAEKMFGWSRTEAIGQRFDQLIIPQRFRREHREGMQNFFRTGISPILNKQTEQIALRRDGSEFPVELSISPLKLGNAYIFSGFIHDISGRKAAEEQIRQSQVNLAIAQNEIRIAQQIQATLSPSAPIITEDFEVTGARLTADKIGGDYYDYFFRNPSQLEMVIADVSGHSIGPALFMVETRSAIRAQTNKSATPSETLGVLNNFLFEDLDKSDYFITLFYLQADIRNKQLRYANAGHPPPLLYSQRQQKFIELDAEGLILGVKRNVVFEEKIILLNHGDLIIFYTDGLIEAENNNKEFFGLDRTKAIVKQNSLESPKTIIDSLLTELKQFRQKSSFEDDITLMVFIAK